MIKPASYTVWFKNISKKDINSVGGKGANLGEMTRAGIPVPNGFVVTAAAYYDFLEHNDLTNQIKSVFKNLDHNNSKALETKARRVRSLILEAKIPENIISAIEKAYEAFSSKSPLVAVRSSATAEDLPDASFAGQQATFLNVKGSSQVVRAVQKCWASLFTDRAVFYRQEKHFNHLKVGIAVPVQLMVSSEVSGVMFTIDPVNNNKNILVVESVWGLGEMIVQGSVTPDHFEIDKKTFTITAKHISSQEKQLIKVGNQTKEIPIAKAKIDRQKVTDSVILRVAKLGSKLQNHYKFPQDVEWAFAEGKIYILQTRPITTIGTIDSVSDTVSLVDEDVRPLLTGASASPGIASGKVKILKSSRENERIKPGDILVAAMTSPDFVPAMKRAAAIITDEGGQTSHAAIVSRELGVPCVVGTMRATSKLKEKQLVTVDATRGKVYSGQLAVRKTRISLPDGVASIGQLKTRTKIYVNLGEPELAAQIANKYVDGVGLLRAEFIISEYIGIHPRYLLEKGRSKFFIDKLAEGLAEFCHAFGSRPVIYRTTDFKSNEYKRLEGGEKYELDEANPMIGFRGAHRYIADDEVFLMELQAIRKVREKMGYTNLHVMIPFVRTIEQLKAIKHTMAIHGLPRRHNFKLYMMVEIPSNVLMLDEFIDVGIDGVSIGSNDLTMLILGCDRDNERVADVYDERNEAVQKALEIIVKTCRKRGIACSICGQAPSTYPEITANLVSWGATSVSVSPDMIDKTRLIVYQAEQRLKKSGKTIKFTSLGRLWVK